jgi:nitroreductase
MDAYKAIISKRDRREYDGRPIPEDAIHRILQAGRMAGSSSNNQNCRLIVLNDRAALEALAPAGRGTAPMLKAPLSIAVVVKEGGSAFDVGRVAQNMMIAAWADGIANCPQGVQDQTMARKALGLPDDYSVGMCVAFGYPAETATPREPRPRIPMEEMVHWGRW